MRFLNRPMEVLEGWHAHIYYDPNKTKKIASDLRTLIVARFPDTRMGRWHDEAVGPHLFSMYQLFSYHKPMRLLQIFCRLCDHWA